MLQRGTFRCNCRIKGVKNAKQYTIPVESALERVRSGENPELTTREKHERECFVVLEEGADAATVEKEIKEMPIRFQDCIIQQFHFHY